MPTLEKDYPEFYHFLDSVQPYNSDYLWLKHLKDFSNEKHIRLTPQTKEETKTMTAKRDNISVTIPIDNPNFSARQGCNGEIYIGGVPVRVTERGIVPLAPGLKTEVKTWVAFLFEGTNINVLGLCRKTIKDGSAIVEKTLGFV